MAALEHQTTNSFILHKYVDEKGIDILQNLRLKANDPSKFNDVFELLCRPEGGISTTMVKRRLKDRDQIERLYQVHKSKGGKGNKRDFKKALRERRLPIAIQLTERFDQMIESYIDETPDIAKAFLRIACFSRQIEDTAREVLMWSYYTRGHRGMRFHFDVGYFSDKWKLSLHEVKYRNRRVPIFQQDVLFETNSFRTAIDESLIVKSDAWSHENEHRLFLDPKECFRDSNVSSDDYFIKINPTHIRKIDLGVNTPIELQEQIVRVLNQDSDLKHVKLTKASVDRNEFKLNYFEIN